MLDSTITRRDSTSIDTLYPSPRTGGIGALNVLVIAATVEDGSVPEGLVDSPLWKRFWSNHRLQRLPHIAKEVAELKQLERVPGGARIQVDVLDGDIEAVRARKANTPWSLADAVEERLSSQPKAYDVVHFAGHALFPPDKPKGAGPGRRKPAASDDRGYLIFSGYPHPLAVPIARVAGWLRGSKQDPSSIELVFLSCCRSSSARAAAELARNDVRMAVGFNWDLDDAKTVDFTKYFYEGLRGRRLSVCSAIREARSRLNGAPDDPVWASPILIAQPSKWFEVEGMLRPPERGAPTGHSLNSRSNISPPPPPSTMQIPGRTSMPTPDPTSEISYEDRTTLIGILARSSQRSDPEQYFRNLIRQADFSDDLRLDGAAGLANDARANALNLVDWAIQISTNPKDRNKALGTILVPFLQSLGLENQIFVASLIVRYKLLASEDELNDLGAQFQIPHARAVLAGAPTVAQPPVKWAKETEDFVLQGWFTPEPELLDVGLLVQAARRARSVCRVEVGATGGKGTGVLIARNLVLTNYHVLGTTLEAPLNVLEQNAATTILRFGAFSASGLKPTEGQQVRLAADKPVVAADPQYDFALLRADDAITAAADVTPFAQTGNVPAVQDALYVMQHPQGGPMKLALSTNGVTWVDPGNIMLQYTTKVAGGSSGSPCFDAQWNLSALHHAGSASKGEGILMRSIFEKIRQFL
jgi:V8-like Glu-specific endopeptidase